jgi:hypothetical protein
MECVSFLILSFMADYIPFLLPKEDRTTNQTKERKQF